MDVSMVVEVIVSKVVKPYAKGRKITVPVPKYEHGRQLRFSSQLAEGVPEPMLVLLVMTFMPSALARETLA
jgi:hypothetical protein